MANKGGYLNKNGSGKDNYSNYSKDNKSGLKDGKLGRESAKNGYKENNSLLKGSGIRRDGGAARAGGMQNSGLPYRDSGRGKSDVLIQNSLFLLYVITLVITYIITFILVIVFILH